MDASRRWKERNKERVKQYNREYRLRNLDRLRQRDRDIKHAKKDDLAYKEECWQSHIKQRYGITADEYKAMLINQSGVCAICRQAETAVRSGKIKKLAVDHCHQTGDIRGLLCQRCNTLISRFDNDEDIILSASRYLAKRKTHAGGTVL